ncbi:MAG: ribosome biogenesis GTPase Der [Deltaproteobacteria bacterium]|nr:ribosome biogenesis GTPase Der [Deltaproteobacteria bacterium]MBW2051245.1 ribosome biogenesis GTPase Der [Deltaproteobacteria bacterium]MBW2140313.1 ribosome biogenesis GTPase Der [Deltaproteobacteria bacterium]MBW2323545.1 ribosome biogenesis GTPase Der [Deltaproteobacteria bacterium]
MRPLVAIVGRPNVGKSTLFNRLVGYNKAIVDNMPGVTRDRNYAEIELKGRAVTLIDTGGFELDADEGFLAQIRFQTLLALEEADLTILLLDGKGGLNPHDYGLVDILRQSERPFILGVNKIDGLEKEDALTDFYSLGVEPLFPLSAAHGYGIRDFLDAMAAELPSGEETPPPENLTRVAIIGRPNVGKSSLVNQLIGQERTLVSEIPGTTRDPVDIEIERQGRHYRFVDTAGIRRKGRVSLKIEKFAIVRALKSLERCDIAVLLIDSLEGITDQDAHVAGYALERGRGLILLFNKWDLVEDRKLWQKKIKGQIELKMRFLPYAPYLTASAKTGLRVQKIFKALDEVFVQYTARVTTGKLNRVLSQTLAAHSPPYIGRQRLKFYYATQARTRPPTFVLFTNLPNKVHFSYQRYLANSFREAFKLDKIPIKIVFRARQTKKK